MAETYLVGNANTNMIEEVTVSPTITKKTSVVDSVSQWLGLSGALSTAANDIMGIFGKNTATATAEEQLAIQYQLMSIEQQNQQKQQKTIIVAAVVVVVAVIVTLLIARK